MAKKKKQKPKKRTRNYEGPDWYLEQQSVSFHDCYAADMADLATADSELNGTLCRRFSTCVE